MDTTTFCRVCFSKATSFVSLYDVTEHSSTVASLIMECTSVMLHLFDRKYPEQICLECFDQLKQSYNFRLRCQSSEIILTDFYKGHKQIQIKIEDDNLVDQTIFNRLNIFMDNKHEFEQSEEGIVFPNAKTTERKNKQSIATNNNQSTNWQTSKHKFENSVSPNRQIELKSTRQRYKPKSPNKAKHVCLFCEKRLSTSARLIKHFFEHKINGVITCPKDGAKFKVVRSFRNHCLTVHRNRQHICPHCGVSLASAVAWSHHVRGKHLKLLPFKCQLCSRAFMFNNLLREHMSQAHSNRRDFACDKCDKKCSTARRLRFHSLKHDEERNYQCSQCPKSFTFPCYLRKHALTHGPRTHLCTFCDKSFTVEKYLQRHMYTHTGERPVACEWCDQRFIQHTSLYSHIRKHHANQKSIETTTEDCKITK